MQLRPFLVWSHRWLGLTNSVVIALAGLTGALIVFPLPEEPKALLTEFHENLFAGEFGRWVVAVASVAALLLQAGGLWLWWPSRSLRLRTTRGWWRFTYDFHNLLGVVALPMMALLAGTGVGRVVFDEVALPDALADAVAILDRANGLLHHGGPFPVPVKALYVLGGLAFVVQAATGVLMWWRPPTAAARNARVSPSAPSPD